MSVDKPMRVLRWTFMRAVDTIVCELSLDDNQLSYELRTARGVPASVSVDRFQDVAQAFHRQSEYEWVWIQEGWSLAAYESSIERLAEPLMS